ncbi:MAG: maleate cis-trans isomerase family protein [Candidatus Binataceae bacterium]
MTVDALGYRMKFGVIAPSTNTIVQPDFDDMRPRGVTNHYARIFIPNTPLNSDADFELLMENIRKELLAAVDRVVTCEPDYLIMGMSSETFWGGLEGSSRFRERVEGHSKLKISMGSDASQEALRRLGARRLGVITPYMPVGDKNVRRFFEESGFELVKLIGLKCDSPVHIAHVTQERLRDAIMEVNSREVDAIVQVGTNLSMMRLAAIAEQFLNKPVIAINTATYWHALRHNGIDDKLDGFGRLLSEL